MECAGLCLSITKCYGIQWDEATKICRTLKENGMRLEANPDLSQVIYVDESNPLPSSFMSLQKCGMHHSAHYFYLFELHFI